MAVGWQQFHRWQMYTICTRGGRIGWNGNMAKSPQFDWNTYTKWFWIQCNRHFLIIILMFAECMCAKYAFVLKYTQMKENRFNVNLLLLLYNQRIHLCHCCGMSCCVVFLSLPYPPCAILDYCLYIIPLVFLLVLVCRGGDCFPFLFACFSHSFSIETMAKILRRKFMERKDGKWIKWEDRGTGMQHSHHHQHNNALLLLRFEWRRTRRRINREHRPNNQPT